MGFFLLLLIIAFVIAGFLSGNNQTNDQGDNRQKVNPTIDTFKKKTFRNYYLKGVYYQKISSSDEGQFKGYVATAFSTHDRYAVDISLLDDRRVGWLPKGNFRMSNYIDSLDNKRVPCYGNIFLDEYNRMGKGKNKLYAEVTIPVLYNSMELEKIDELFSKHLLITNHLLKHKELSWKEALAVFKLDEDIQDLNDLFKTNYNYTNISGLFSRWTAIHEKENNLNELADMNVFKDLISRLNKKNKEASIRRIQTALIKLGRNIK